MNSIFVSSMFSFLKQSLKYVEIGVSTNTRRWISLCNPKLEREHTKNNVLYIPEIVGDQHILYGIEHAEWVTFSQQFLG